MTKSPITTHVLDVSKGRPAAGVPVMLELYAGKGRWKRLGVGVTNADGRVLDLLAKRVRKGRYRLTFEVASYFRMSDRRGFYPFVTVDFYVDEPSEHYHVPLLLSPYGYSTYRGS